MSKIWTPQSFLAPPKMAEYVPRHFGGRAWSSFRRVPPFTMTTIEQMLSDPRIGFGLYLLKGPCVANAKFFIRTKNSSLRSFLQENISRFWMKCAMRALRSIEWGCAAGEILSKITDGDLMFDDIIDIDTPDVKCYTIGGKIVKARVRMSNAGMAAGEQIEGGMDICRPKLFWTAQRKEFHPYYGRSRLFGAYLPWLEKWSDGGFRDARRLFYFKYAYTGGILYFPPGSTILNDDGSGNGTIIDNMELARTLLERMRNGGTLVLPNRVDDGHRAWEYVDASAVAPPTGLIEYGGDLSDEEWEGMGIPPEVARAEGTGAYAGRIVPMQAFYAILQEILNKLIEDADEWIFRPLAMANFGAEGDDYDIIPFPIHEVVEKKYGTDAQPAMPQQEGGQQPPPDSSQKKPQGSAFSLFSDDPPEPYMAA